MEHVNFDKVSISGGFWQKRQQTIKDVTLMSVYNQFSKTGRFKALECKWKNDMPDKPHIFWDSDVAKWIESVAYILQVRRDAGLEKLVDDAVDSIYQNRDENGYFNSYFLVADKNLRWHDRTEHELYCAGHLIEAAVAYYKATGKARLLQVAEDFTDYIYKVFVDERSAGFVTPGHEEIELALIKLYNLTGKDKYLELSHFFVDNRGKSAEREYIDGAHGYSQSHLPVRQQKTAEGHAVRAVYLYSAMADLARIDGDNELFSACDTIFDNIVNRRMYITGGIGSFNQGEEFTLDYDLPTLTAYAESCAAIGLAFFARRMSMIKPDSKYADAAERAIYNNILSGISLDGKSFFYTNPLEIRTQLKKDAPYCRDRQWLPETQRCEVFGCSCCPPNITRFIASIGDFLYTHDNDTVFVHQYMQSDADFNGISISQSTDYPNNGGVTLKINGATTVALRIPGWCRKLSLKLNGKDAEYRCKLGYAYISLCKADNVIDIDFDMPTRFVYPSQMVRDCAGRVAVCKGPVVYCAEGVDNSFNIFSFIADTRSSILSSFNEKFNFYSATVSGIIPVEAGTLYSEEKPEYEKAQLKMIPYFAFANRGESDMGVFVLHD